MEVATLTHQQLRDAVVSLAYLASEEDLRNIVTQYGYYDIRPQPRDVPLLSVPPSGRAAASRAVTPRT